jgi:isocitrate dehydrogenase
MSAEKIRMISGKLVVPDQPVIPFIEGDGTGPDIWAASVRVMDAAVEKAYHGKRKIAWMEVLAGEKAFHEAGNWLRKRRLMHSVSILSGLRDPNNPVGGGFRSLNVALRRSLTSMFAQAGTPFQRCAFPCASSGKGGYAYFPGKHRRYLRRN